MKRTESVVHRIARPHPSRALLVGLLLAWMLVGGARTSAQADAQTAEASWKDLASAAERVRAQRPPNYPLSRWLLERAVEGAEAAGATTVEKARLLEQAGRLEDVWSGLLEDRSRASYLRSLELSVTRLGPAHPAVSEALDRLADDAAGEGRSRYEEAEEMLLRSLRIREAFYGEDCPEVTPSLALLAALYASMERVEPAEAEFRRCAGILDHAGIHDDVWEGCLASLEGLLERQARYEEAVAVRERLFAHYARQQGESRPSGASAQPPLDADALCRRAEAALTAQLDEEGLGGPERARRTGRLARQIWICGDGERAKTTWERALGILGETVGLEHPVTTEVFEGLAEMYALGSWNDPGDDLYAQAEPLFAKALALREKLLGADDPSLASSLFWLGELSRAEGRLSQAEGRFRRCASVLEAAGRAGPAMLECLVGLETTLRQAGRAEQVESVHAWGRRHGFEMDPLSAVQAFPGAETALARKE